MGASVHRLSNVDLQDKTAICAFCGPVKIKVWPERNGKIHRRCLVAVNIERGHPPGWVRKRAPRGQRSGPKHTYGAFIYRRYKKEACEWCGFTGHPCQLDVDHKDGNRHNNDPSNLQTLCANCHRIKTHHERQARHPSAASDG